MMQRGHQQIAELAERVGTNDTVVVVADQELERCVDLAALASEIEDAAVIAAGKHQNLAAPGHRARGADRH